MNEPSSSFADKSVLSHSPMELTDEEKKRFAAMWDNVPPEHTITLNAEESKAFAEWLNNPPPLNEKLVELMTNESVLEKLRRELYDQIGVPKHLAEGDLPPNV